MTQAWAVTKMRTTHGPEFGNFPESRTFALVKGMRELHHQQTKNLLTTAAQGHKFSGPPHNPAVMPSDTADCSDT